MKRKMTVTEAWNWYDGRPWLTGCNYVPSKSPALSLWQGDTLEEILPTARRELDLVRDLGMNTVRMGLPFDIWYHERDQFLDRLDFILSLLDERGIALMPILFNDCVNFGRPKDVSIPYPKGKHDWDVGYHGGHAVNPFNGTPEISGNPGLSEKDRFFSNKGWIFWDEEEYRPALLEYVRQIFRRFGKDGRIVIWDMWNEPGNCNRGALSAPYMKSAFKTAREEDPIQPLTAGVWTYPERFGKDGAADLDEIGRLALDLSDVVSFHCYSRFEKVKNVVKALEREGRPMLNTEWLNRLLGNRIEDQLPFYREKKIGSYLWGCVAGYSQHYLPWGNLLKDKSLDFTLWQHDLYRGDGKPYDADEIDLIRRINAAK